MYHCCFGGKDRCLAVRTGRHACPPWTPEQKVKMCNRCKTCSRPSDRKVHSRKNNRSKTCSRPSVRKVRHATDAVHTSRNQNSSSDSSPDDSNSARQRGNVVFRQPIGKAVLGSFQNRQKEYPFSKALPQESRTPHFYKAVSTTHTHTHTPFQGKRKHSVGDRRIERGVAGDAGTPKPIMLHADA